MAFEPLTPERRRQQTREYLIKAAELVFAERGFHGATLDEVAAVAGFTKGAVYSNFKNKEDLFLALLESRYQQERDTVRAALDSSEPVEAHLGDFATMIRDQFEAGGDVWAALDLEFCLYAMRNSAVREKLAAFRRMVIDFEAEIIESQRKEERVHSPESSRHAARIVFALMSGVAMMRMIDPETVDEAFLGELIEFVYRALTSSSRPPAPTT
jgi:AcrR family transcriptional regulator